MFVIDDRKSMEGAEMDMKMLIHEGWSEQGRCMLLMEVDFRH